ncbi:MAG: DNA-processing protein DprA [Phycisphaerae bacterium]
MRDRNPVISDIGREYLRFQLINEVGPLRLRRLVAHFGALDAVLGASMDALAAVDGIGQHIAGSILRARNDDVVDRAIERAGSCGLYIICAEDAEYPAVLLNTPDPPICLYVRGQLEPADAVAVAVVGARRCSHYGREQALRFGELLGRAGFTVVSGLARGIDGHAHRGALQGGWAYDRRPGKRACFRLSTGAHGACL